MLEEILNKRNIYYQKDIDIAEISSYKAGGIASYLVEPSDTEELIYLINYLKDNNIKYDMIGNLTNVLYSDKRFDGVLISLKRFNHIIRNGKIITVGVGYPLIALAHQVADLSLTGLEFACNIPGTVGGAIYMNAGAYQSDMKMIVKEVKVLTPDLEELVLTNKDLDFKYRTSFLKENIGYICLEATLILSHGNKSDIKDMMDEMKSKRVASQPVDMPSAGSVFRNPENQAAWKLIADSGMQGKGLGEAQVSLKHANFIVNTGNAKAQDIFDLTKVVQDEVFKQFGISLHCEQEFKNFD